ncbi:MAG: hypothetical protein IJL91_06970 [Bacteroidales bacterium]|nr:hypothetical protein [Bacteroidales bacterium]
MTMYLGPIIKGVTRKNQIFNYDPTEVKAKAIEICPAAKYLFVDLEDIATKKKELNTPGSLLALAYKQLEEAQSTV